MSEKKQQPAYPLRMPAELREQLEEIAGANKRSLNAEIIARLEASFDQLSAPRRGGVGKEDLMAPLPEKPELPVPGANQSLQDLIAASILRAAEQLAEQMSKQQGRKK